MKVALELVMGGIESEVELQLDICPLCSQIEDHEHKARLTRHGEDQLDGGPLKGEARKAVMAMHRGAK